MFISGWQRKELTENTSDYRPYLSSDVTEAAGKTHLYSSVVTFASAEM